MKRTTRKTPLFFRQITILFFILISSWVFSQSQPNVLMLVVDDMNNMIGNFGNERALTPNLDKLGDRGVRLVNTHVAATYCAPSRTSIMTGIAPWNSGAYEDQPHMYNNPDQKAIPSLFKKNGYDVFGAGKVYHHTPGYMDLRGYDEVFHWDDTQKSLGWPIGHWGANDITTPANTPVSDVSVAINWANFDIAGLDNSLEDDMADTRLATWAVNKLNAMSGTTPENPFFMALGLYAPHKPNYVPQKYLDMYPLETIPFPDFLASGTTLTEKTTNDRADIPASVIAAYTNRINRVAPAIADEDLFKEMLQGYYAAVSYADAQLGRILDALDASGQVDNTIVVFWSDNGYHVGEKGIFAKHTLWNRTTNIPCIMAGPGIAEDTNYNGVISSLDIYPTLVAQCGLTGPSVANLDGQDISAQLTTPGTVDTSRRVVTVETDGVSFTVSSNQYKYINYQPSGAEELYDILVDPNEWTNLATNPAYSSVITDLSSNIPANPVPASKGRDELDLVITGETFEWVLTDDGSGSIEIGDNMILTSPKNSLNLNASFDTEADDTSSNVSWNFIKVGTQDITELGGTATITADVYNVQNVNTGTYVNTSAGSDLESLDPLEDTDNFKFHLEPTGSLNQYYIRNLASGYTLRLENNVTTTKFQFQASDKVGNNWKWNISKNVTPVVNTFETQIQNEANKLFVAPDVTGKTFVNSIQTTDDFYWVFTEVSNNIFTIENKSSNQFLSDKIDEVVTANKLTLENRFKWELLPTGIADQFNLKNIETGLYAYRSSANGNQLKLAVLQDSDNFKWNFISTTEKHSYLFETKDDNEGWVPFLGNMIVNNGALTFLPNSVGDNSKLALSNHHVNADNVTTMTIVLKNNSTDDDELRVRLTVGGNITPTITTSDTEPKTYHYDMTSLTKWHGLVGIELLPKDADTDRTSATGSIEIDSIVFDNTVLSVEDVDFKDDTNISLYPNPVQNRLNIESSKRTINKVEIYNLLGQKSLEFGTNADLNVSALSKGVFIVKIFQDNGIVSTKRFVKE